jgi:PhnB protein
MANDQYRTVTPYLKLPNSGRLVEFLKIAFNAVEKARLSKPDGSLLHAEIVIGDTLLMVHELPATATPKPCTLFICVPMIATPYLSNPWRLALHPCFSQPTCIMARGSRA